MNSDPKAFYDAFTPQFVRDYIRGNARLERQFDFLKLAIPRSARRVLIVGAGSGESAHFIAQHAAPHAQVLATDLSSENQKLGKTLFAHSRVEYQALDITGPDRPAGDFDIIVIPDAYEHFPADTRKVVHAKLAALMSEQGQLLLTLPSRWKQHEVVSTGVGKQPVDEVVEVQDLLDLATDLGGTLTYLNTISVWNAHDYLHAVISRIPDGLGPINPKARSLREIAGSRTLGSKVFRGLRAVCRWARVQHQKRASR